MADTNSDKDAFERYWDNKTNMDWRKVTEQDKRDAEERVRELIEKTREELGE